MAYPPHFLLQFGGSRSPTTTEIWTCGIRLIVAGGGTDGLDAQAFINGDGGDALSDWFTRPASAIGTVAKLGFVKLNEIDSTGHYANQATIEREYVPAWSGGGGNSIGMPFQSAVCLSWETTTRSRGAGSKGRIYSPAPQVQVNADNGLFGAATAQGMATSAATLIEALRAASDGGASVVPAIVSAVGIGQAVGIDRVRVDNRVDIIRKRAAQLTAVSSFAAVDV